MRPGPEYACGKAVPPLDSPPIHTLGTYHTCSCTKHNALVVVLRNRTPKPSRPRPLPVPATASPADRTTPVLYRQLRTVQPKVQPYKSCGFQSFIF